MKNFDEIIKERYSVRKFKDEKINEEIINSILEAGNLAPTACNNQPQKIYVVTSEKAREKIKKCTMCHFDAPLIFIIAYDKNISWKRSYDGKDSGYVDCSIVATHMMLKASELGIGSTWVMHFNPEAIKCEFELDDNTEPVALLVMGKASDDCPINDRHNQRKDIKGYTTIL